MKRAEILERLGFHVPANKVKRVIVHSDIAAEADDQFAIVHHLLTPTENIVGIIAANFEWKYRTLPALKSMRLQSMEKSYAEGKKLLQLMDIDDVPVFKGALDCIGDSGDLPISEGSRFIIEQAMQECEEPLYVVLQGTLTDLAVAYLTEPKIAEHIEAAIWIGGGAYPDGGMEFNLQQDIRAAQVLFQSPINIWQVPKNAYSQMRVSFAELMTKVKPCGPLGEYLVEGIFRVNNDFAKTLGRNSFTHGETWAIGDQPTVSVLLESDAGAKFHMEKAPLIGNDMTYTVDPNGKLIRVYDDIDTRLTTADLFAKLELCYRR